MEYIYRLPFTVLEVPNLKLKRPSWFVKPSAMVVFSFILLSYFLVTGGIIYDVIVEPPSVGSTTDEHGHTRPVRKPNKRNMLYWVGTKVRSVCKLKLKAKIQIFIHRISNSIFLLFAIFEVAFMPYRVNGQYIMEGLASSFLFTLGGIGFIVLDQTHNPSTPKLNRILLICVGFISVIVSFATCWIFMRMKLPGYLQS